MGFRSACCGKASEKLDEVVLAETEKGAGRKSGTSSSDSDDENYGKKIERTSKAEES